MRQQNDFIQLPLTRKKISVSRSDRYNWETEKKLTEMKFKSANIEAQKLLAEVEAEWFTGETNNMILKVKFDAEGNILFDHFTRTLKAEMSNDRIMMETIKCYELATRARQEVIQSRGTEIRKTLNNR